MTARSRIDAVERAAARHRVPMGNGGTLAWRVWGAGSGRPPLLLLHGGNGSWLHWIANVEALAGRFTVHVPDLPGLGESDAPDDLRDIWSVTSCMKTAFLAMLGDAGPVPVAGFSFGSMVAGHLAFQLPERIAAIALVGAGGFRLTRTPTDKLRRLLPDMDRATLEAEAQRNLALLMIHDPARIDDIAIEMQIVNSLAARTRSKKIGQQGVLTDILPRIATPLCGIWGERDTTMYPHWAERVDFLNRVRPGLALETIGGAGHWVAYEAADRFNRLLPDLLCKASTSSPRS